MEMEKGKERVLDIKTKCIFAIEMILVIGLVWTALYISFTEAGIEEILGTQARYYYPFIFMFYLCFQTDKIKNTIELGKISDDNYACKQFHHIPANVGSLTGKKMFVVIL